MKNGILEVKNLTKMYGKFTAVNNISFSMVNGEILGLLGPNGAGKTTTIQMLLGVLKPSSGSITYFGKDLVKNREDILEKINFSSTYINLPWYLTVRENLTWVSYLYEIKNRKKRISDLVEAFRLDEIINKSIGQLSAGQMTRVNLAKSFLNSPKIMLLDEPTASLDPDVAQYIREFLESEKEKYDISVIFTSHNMAEVEELCDRVIFINRGKIVSDDTPDNLAKKIEISHIELLIRDGLKRTVEYCNKNSIPYRMESKRYIVIDVKEKEIAKILRNLMDAGIVYDEISIEKPTLEDYFLQIAKEEA